jgi:hypothetical protein
MRIIIAILLFLICLTSEAASPSFAAFDTSTMVVIPQSGSNPSGFIGVRTDVFPTNGSPLTPSLYNTNYNEIWITPVGTNDGAGNGTMLNPYVCTTAATFDQLLMRGVLPQVSPPWVGSIPPTNTLIPINSTIHLMAGTFHDTNGIIMQSGWRLIGAGRAQTIIMRDPTTNSWYNNDVIGGQSDFLPCNRSNMVVENLTIDLNRQNQLLATSDYAAVVLTGDNALIKDCRAINMGLAATNAEGASVFSIETYGGNFYGTIESNIVHNGVIDGCSLGNMAAMMDGPGSGIDGFGIGGFGFYGNTSNSSSINLEFPATLSITNGWIVGAEIKNCYLECPITNNPSASLSAIGMPGYFHAAGIATYTQNLKIHNNIFQYLFPATGTGSGDATAVYGEQGPYQGVEIYNNVLWNVCIGIGQRGSNSNQKNDINIHDNFIRYGGQAGSQGIGLGGSSATNELYRVTIQNNDVAALNGQTNASTFALTLNFTTNTVVQNNYLDNAGAVDALIYSTNSFLKWFNNWNGQGTNPIQTTFSGLGQIVPDKLVADQVVASFYGNGGGVSNVPAILAIAYTNVSGTPIYGTNSNNSITAIISTNLNGGNAALASNVVAGIIITNAILTNSTFFGNGGGITGVLQSSITAPYQAGQLYIEEDIPLTTFSTVTGNAPTGAGQTPTPYFTQPYLTAFTPASTLGRYFLTFPQWVTNLVLRAQYQYSATTPLFWTNDAVGEAWLPVVGEVGAGSSTATFTLNTNGYTYVYYTNNIISTFGTNCVKGVVVFSLGLNLPTNVLSQVSITGFHAWYKGYYDGSNW